MSQRMYEAPQVTDFGGLVDLTASYGAPVATDVPEGTPTNGDISSVLGPDKGTGGGGGGLS